MRIAQPFGVCSVREDTEHLAAAAGEGKPGRALDLGTGTGYVAIYLALRGWSVDAIDVSEKALETARGNVARNGVSVNVFRSRLYAATKGVYDVIACNPPQRENETDLSRWVTSTLRRNALVADVLTRATQPVLQRRRMAFLGAIALGALERLAPGGRIVLVISPYEIERLCASAPGLVLVEQRRIPRMTGLEVAIFRAALRRRVSPSRPQ